MGVAKGRSLLLYLLYSASQVVLGYKQATYALRYTLQFIHFTVHITVTKSSLLVRA